MDAEALIKMLLSKKAKVAEEEIRGEMHANDVVKSIVQEPMDIDPVGGKAVNISILHHKTIDS